MGHTGRHDGTCAAVDEIGSRSPRYAEPGVGRHPHGGADRSARGSRLGPREYEARDRAADRFTPARRVEAARALGGALPDPAGPALHRGRRRVPSGGIASRDSLGPAVADAADRTTAAAREALPHGGPRDVGETAVDDDLRRRGHALLERDAENPRRSRGGRLLRRQRERRDRGLRPGAHGIGLFDPL